MDRIKRFYYKTNKLGKLQIFIKLYELGSVTKVANELYVSQPSISMQIKSLENDIGSKLFDKVGRYLVSTSDGHLFYKSIINHVVGVENIFKNFRDIRNSSLTKRVRIAACQNFISIELGKYLSRLDNDIKIHILDLSGTEAIEKLLTNDLDMIIYPLQKLPPNLISVEIASYKALLAANSDHPLAKSNKIMLNDLANENVINVNSEFVALGIFNELSEQYKWNSNITFDSQSIAIPLHFVQNNLGIAIVSELCCAAKNIVFKDVSHIFPNTIYAISVNKFAFLSDEAIKVIKLFDKSFGEKVGNPRDLVIN